MGCILDISFLRFIVKWQVWCIIFKNVIQFFVFFCLYFSFLLHCGYICAEVVTIFRKLTVGIHACQNINPITGINTHQLVTCLHNLLRCGTYLTKSDSEPGSESGSGMCSAACRGFSLRTVDVSWGVGSAPGVCSVVSLRIIHDPSTLSSETEHEQKKRPSSSWHGSATQSRITSSVFFQRNPSGFST